jgi:hypothetical protein
LSRLREVFPGHGADNDSVLSVQISCTKNFLRQHQALTPMAQLLVTDAIKRINNTDTHYEFKNSYVRLSSDTKSGYHNLRAIEMTFGWRVVVAESDGFYNPVAVFRNHEQYDEFLDDLRRNRPQKRTKYPRPNEAMFDMPVDLTRIHIRPQSALSRLTTSAMRQEGRIGQHEEPDYRHMGREYAYNEFVYPIMIDNRTPVGNNIATLVIDEGSPTNPPAWATAAEERARANMAARQMTVRVA